MVLLFFALTTGDLLAQGMGKQQNSPPFLITGKLPHLTKLLVIRQETIGGAQRLGKEIKILEQQVVEGSLGGKPPEDLQSLVQNIAKLKTEATMVHLRCIFNTSKILDQGQLAVLKKLTVDFS